MMRMDYRPQQPDQEGLTADQWNSLHPIGTPVVAYPGFRPGDGLADLCTELRTVTRTPAWTLGHGAAVVSVEGYAGGIALTHVDVVCGSQCPSHDHVCQRSPQHQRGICRDQRQKGTESCTWDPAAVSAAVKGLARLVAGREGCWLIRTPDDCALIVPEGDRLVFRRTFKRPTVDVAVRLGLVALGDGLHAVPEFAGRPKWLDGEQVAGSRIFRTEVAL